jgi:hypothetical protein
VQCKFSNTHLLVIISPDLLISLDLHLLDRAACRRCTSGRSRTGNILTYKETRADLTDGSIFTSSCAPGRCHSQHCGLTDGEMYLLALTRTALHWTMQYRIKRRTQMSSRGQRQVLAYSGPFRSGHHACFRCESVHRYGETRDLFRSMLCWRWLAIFLQI